MDLGEPKPQFPQKIVFSEDVYGIDYVRDYKNGVYHGEVFSREKGNGPTCLNAKGEKTYSVKSGDVNGVPVNGECDVYELDLSQSGMSFDELNNPQKLREIIESRQAQITMHKLVPGEEYKIAPMILHQPCSQGVLSIKVPSDYKPELFIESDDLDLSSFVKK